MVNLVLIGPPGAGKGTQAERLVRDYGLMHVSTGDLLREAIRAATPLGREARTAVDSGALVPDEVVIGLVEERLSSKKPEQGFILDGFPRTVTQAEALEHLLQSLNTPLDHVIVFDIPIGLLEDRIGKRAEQSQAASTPTRSDDNVNVLKKRVEEFARATAALTPFYDHRQLLRRVNAAAGIDEVAAEISSLLRH
ncbi:adenylate kinase family protein [Rhizobium leguminosarum bv. trifolii WSM597]|nr:adenylate kinase family protein [Rhizobium leguminosarum bv. trifolii WSM597]EJB08344.1 adenylate kinase family protein [Rhizobium leguminosarum bv. trifolii WSM597]